MSGFFGQAAGLIFAGVSAATDYARGWGKRIEWHSLLEGQRLAKEQNKPAMIVIHKDWCPACKALKPRFAKSRDIEQLSHNFVMINVENDEEPKTDYKPDGGYIPRILFTDPKGQLIKEVFNKKREEMRYFYGDEDSIIDAMRTVQGKVFTDDKKKNKRGSLR